MITAITGGIGSGKSYYCQQLVKQGIVVYDCDREAKRLMQNDLQLQQKINVAVGKPVFHDGGFDKVVLSEFILRSEENVQTINNIVHPAVAEDFVRSGLQWLESAILFESGFNKRVHIDRVICVTAPLEVRIERIMKRDGVSREKALEWINRQMPQEEKLRLANLEIDSTKI